VLFSLGLGSAVLPERLNRRCELSNSRIEEETIRVAAVGVRPVVPVAERDHVVHPPLICLGRSIRQGMVRDHIVGFEIVDSIADGADRMQLLPIMRSLLPCIRAFSLYDPTANTRQDLHGLRLLICGTQCA
jgi:hypothetical protein